MKDYIGIDIGITKFILTTVRKVMVGEDTEGNRVEEFGGLPGPFIYDSGNTYLHNFICSS